MIAAEAFEFVGLRPHTRKDGMETRLIVWKTKCTCCGVSMEFMTPTKFKVFQPNRRCKEHRRPGVSVRHDGYPIGGQA